MNVSQPTSQHRSRVLILWASQITAFILVLLYVGLHTGRAAQLPRIFLQGTILAQCGLAAAFAVFGRWQPHFRMACSAAIVVGGVLAIEVANELSYRLMGARTQRFEMFLMIALFALLLWAVMQVPFWLVRLFL